MKTEHRINRNLQKGITGDNINMKHATEAFNFKGKINKWKSPFWLEFKIKIVDLIKSGIIKSTIIQCLNWFLKLDFF